MTAHAASQVYFGLNPMWVSTCILAVTYACIMSEKVNRAIIALVGASVMIVVGVLDQNEAIKGIDWNTIGLLTGMMILVSISRRSGMFQYLAIWSAKAAKAHPAGILFILQITTAVLSAFLDAPPGPGLNEAKALLTQLGAIDAQGRITAEGRQLRALPLPPRLARMVVDASAEGAGEAAASIAAVITERGLGGDDPDLRHRLDQFRRCLLYTSRSVRRRGAATVTPI